MFRRTSYLQRIAYEGPMDPTQDTLAKLSRAHLLAVPFENLDVILGEEILLDEERVYGKIVERWRGGFCYELNGLFALLLRDLGFEVDLLAMQFAEDDGYGPERDHLTLLVRAPDDDNRWLTDVGAGRHSLVTPVALDDPAEQPHPHDGAVQCVVRGSGDFWHLWRREIDGDWQELYRFTLQPHAWDAFTAMCHHHQTSPDSPFTQRRRCTRLTPTGRITLLDDLLTITEPTRHRRVERHLRGQPAIDAVVRKHFGIGLCATDAQKVRSRQASSRKDKAMRIPNGTGTNRSVHVLGLGGSLRPESNSLIALEDALRLAAEAGAETTLVSVRDLALPIYNPTLSADEQPAALRRLLDQVRAADAFIFCSPTYHGTVSGAVKNVLDALNGLARDQPRYLGGKPVGLMALGGGSAMNTINALAHATRALNGLATTTVVTVPGAAVDPVTRQITDPLVRQRLATMVSEVLDLGSRLQAEGSVVAGANVQGRRARVT